MKKKATKTFFYAEDITLTKLWQVEWSSTPLQNNPSNLTNDRTITSYDHDKLKEEAPETHLTLSFQLPLASPSCSRFFLSFFLLNHLLVFTVPYHYQFRGNTILCLLLVLYTSSVHISFLFNIYIFFSKHRWRVARLERSYGWQDLAIKKGGVGRGCIKFYFLRSCLLEQASATCWIGYNVRFFGNSCCIFFP